MNLKTLGASDLGRRIKYTLPYKASRKAGEQTVFPGILVDYDKTHVFILVEAVQKTKFKASHNDVEFI